MITTELMQENRPGWITKIFFTALLLIAAGIAILNMLRGRVFHPVAFFVVLAGFVMFAVGKISVIRHGKLFTFGARPMTTAMANLYRFGYWLMIVGLLVTFID